MASKGKPPDAESAIKNQRAVLIVSDDAEFAHTVSGAWQAKRVVPSFALLDGELKDFDQQAFDLVVVGPIGSRDVISVLRTIDPEQRPVILVVNSSTAPREFPRLLVIRQNDGWPGTLVQLAQEVLRRVEAVHRAERAEHLNATLKTHATLGHFVIEMRHTLNNALTSVLGNSELLLLEPGAFTAGVRSQIETIRNMALRMHEILQRFSSLEKEMSFVEKQVVKGDAIKAQVATVGSVKLAARSLEYKNSTPAD